MSSSDKIVTRKDLHDNKLKDDNIVDIQSKVEIDTRKKLSP